MGKSQGIMKEEDIQKRFVQLLDRLNSQQEAGILYCTTQGGIKLSIGAARKMVSLGYRKGIPDVMIYTPSGGKVGLALELKTLKGRASVDQRRWIQELKSYGWDAQVVYGYDRAVEALLAYFPELKEPLGH